MIERSIQYDYLITGNIVIGMITGVIDPPVSLVSNQVLAQLFQFDYCRMVADPVLTSNRSIATESSPLLTVVAITIARC